MRIEDIDQDAVAEFFNMGMGQAAVALSDLMGCEVELSIPQTIVVTYQDVPAALGADRDGSICLIRESFSGEFAGDAILIFSEQSGLELLQRLMPSFNGQPPAQMTDEEGEALSEIGNIILNGCLACFANLMSGEIHGASPHHRIGAPLPLLTDVIRQHGVESEHVLLVRIDLTLSDTGSCCQTLFLLNLPALESFSAAVMRFLTAQTSL